MLYDVSFSPSLSVISWAHGTTSAVSDRISIIRGAAWPEINLAPQGILICSSSKHFHAEYSRQKEKTSQEEEEK